MKFQYGIFNFHGKVTYVMFIQARLTNKNGSNFSIVIN